MPRIENRLGLPQPFVEALQLDKHNQKGCLSSTTLNKGTKEIILMDRHWEDMEMEVADNIWNVWGSAVHLIFEKYTQGVKGFESEKNYSYPMGEHTITGTVDCYDGNTNTLYDWKTCSAWKIKMGDFKDWKQQGSVYAWLMDKNGVKVDKVRFVALIKDFSNTEAKRNPQEYPQSPVYVMEFDVTPELLSETEKRIAAKELDIRLAKALEDDEISPCSSEERWASAPKFAVKKEGVQKAVKLFDDEEGANALAQEKGKGYFVEKRPEINRKCDDYCPCAQFCSFYKQTHGGVL